MTYSVSALDADGWRVVIVDAAGRTVFDRSCSGRAEAETLRSTVEQHRAWLSVEKFRRYYRLPASDGGPGNEE
jgi:hypothetical protein